MNAHGLSDLKIEVEPAESTLRMLARSAFNAFALQWQAAMSAPRTRVLMRDVLTGRMVWELTLDSPAQADREVADLRERLATLGPEGLLRQLQRDE